MLRRIARSSQHRKPKLEPLEIRQLMTGNGWGDEVPNTPSVIVATVLSPQIESHKTNLALMKASFGKSAADPSVILNRLIASENAKAKNVTLDGADILIEGTEDKDQIQVTDLPDGKLLIEIQSFPVTGKGINQTYVAQVRRDSPALTSQQRLKISGVLIDAKGGDDTVITRTTVPLFAFGGEGQDVLHSQVGGNTLLYGGNGQDTLIGSPQDDFLYGEEGNDTLFGHGGADRLEGGPGHNWMSGGSGRDTIDASEGYGDELYGDENVDELIGSIYADVLSGGEGSDNISGRSGNDILLGDSGEDTLDGGAGNDQLFGGSENDTLHGGDGNDELFGEDGLDWLLGGLGDDILDGGADAYHDNLIGGLGVDYFLGNYVTVHEKSTHYLGFNSKYSYFDIRENIVDRTLGDMWQYACRRKVSTGPNAGGYVAIQSPWDILEQLRAKIGS